MELYPEFYNDVFGPIMQPGSSSHMAGPCRVTWLCNSLLGEEVADIRIELDKDGSLAGTMGTMNEDYGLYNGAMGRSVSDPDFFDIFDTMKAKGVHYEIVFGSMKESDHANAIKCVLTGRSGKKVSLVGNSIGGGMAETVWVDGYRFSDKGDTWVLCVFDADNSLDGAALTAAAEKYQGVLSHGTGEGREGGTLYWYKISEAPSEEMKKVLGNAKWGVLKPLLPVPTTVDKKPQLFDTMTEWRRLADEQGKTMAEVAIDYEVAASGWSREEVIEYMREKVQKTLHRRVYAVANKEVEVPEKPFFSPTWKLWGENMADAKLVKGMFAKTLYYVFSARVAVPGVLNVPGPQGNGGGFMAGVLYSVMEELGLSDEDMLRGLFVAAGVGAICYTRTAPTGEVIGCAGECGICSAMTAAALAEMLHGTTQQVENAASFALQATVGWPCDIIPGGMGMPCASRIMHMAIMSITYAQFALVGEDPILPFHEVVDVADKVGKMYPANTHCTGVGGLCMAPTAKECGEKLRAWREANQNK